MNILLRVLMYLVCHVIVGYGAYQISPTLYHCAFLMMGYLIFIKLIDIEAAILDVGIEFCDSLKDNKD